MKYIEEVALKDVDLTITENEMRANYEQNKAKYSQETATVRHILFLTEGKSPDEVKKVKTLAEDVKKRAKAGEDFVSLVETYSEDPGSKTIGGLYENFTRGRMVQTFEDASFTLPIGSISDLVETPYGYHIIKIEERQEGKKFEDVREEVKLTLEEQKREAAFPLVLDALVAKYDFKFTL